MWMYEHMFSFVVKKIVWISNSYSLAVAVLVIFKVDFPILTHYWGF